MRIIECTYGHDDDDERDEDLEPEHSGADIVEMISGIEGSIEDALELVGGMVETDDDDEAETLTCVLCNKVEPEIDAITRGWIPEYIDGDAVCFDPVCVECCASKIFTNSDGENELIKVAH